MAIICTEYWKYPSCHVTRFPPRVHVTLQSRSSTHLAKAAGWLAKASAFRFHFWLWASFKPISSWPHHISPNFQGRSLRNSVSGRRLNGKYRLSPTIFTSPFIASLTMCSHQVWSIIVPWRVPEWTASYGSHKGPCISTGLRDSIANLIIFAIYTWRLMSLFLRLATSMKKFVNGWCIHIRLLLSASGKAKNWNSNEL